MATARSKSHQPAEIRLTVVGFQNVLDDKSTCRNTGYALKLLKRHPLVYIKKGLIHVRAPGATIQFTIASSREDKANYFPAAITFVRESDCNTSDEQRLGLLNFPQRRTRVIEKTISITDTYRDRKEVIKYKFSVIIQRGSDGAIGVIDPGIVHDGSDIRN